MGRKLGCVLLALLFVFTFYVPASEAPGLPFPVTVTVTLEDAPVDGADVLVTLPLHPDLLYEYAPGYGDGTYQVNLDNSPYKDNWDDGDPVKVEVTYQEGGTYYCGEDQKLIDKSKGGLDFDISLEECQPNYPPEQPVNPSPADGATGVEPSPALAVNVSDPNGDSMDVTFYNASDGSLIGTATNVPNGTASVVWSEASAYDTTYTWYANVTDGTYTNQSAEWRFTTRDSEPPGTPSRPSGPSEGDINATYDYSTQASDPDGDDVQYGFDWDDGSSIEWTSYKSSGATATASHAWSSPGTYEVKVRARDTAGKTSGWSNARTVTISQKYTLTAETSPDDVGTVTLDPDGGTYDAGTNVTATATCSPDYLFHNWSGDVPAAKAEDNPVTVAMDDDKTIVARFVENHRPHISISTPGEGTECNGTVTVAGTAGDENGNDTLQTVEIKIDEGTWTTATGTTTWEYAWNTTTVPDGNHTIHARVSDGFLSNATSINVTVSNNRPPAIPSLSGPAEGSPNVSYTFSASSTDPNNHSVRYGFDWDSDGEVDNWTALVPSGETAAHTYSWNMTGQYSIQVMAEDEWGMRSNWSDLHSINISEGDATPPYCTLAIGKPSGNLSYGGVTYPAIASDTPIWINASDGNGTGVAWLNVSVWWNETAPGTYTRIDTITVSDNGAHDSDARTGYISAELHFDEECFHEIQWKASDYANNSSPEHTADIAVDGTAPSVNSTLGDPYYVGSDPSNATTWTWAACNTSLWLNATDGGCGGGVGAEQLGIHVYWNEIRVQQGDSQYFTLIDTVVVEDGGPLDAADAEGVISFNFSFPQEGFYEVVYWALDSAGTNATSKQKIVVDCTSPASEIQNIHPFEQEAPFTVTVGDVSDGPAGQGCGVDTLALYYKYSEDNVTFSEWRLYETWDVPAASRYDVPPWTVSFDPDEGHGYYRFASKAVDCLGNDEPIDGHDTGCYNNLSLTIGFGDPQHGPWVSPATPVTISAHLSPPPDIYYRIYNNGSWTPSPGTGSGDNGSYIPYEGTFTLAEHGCAHGNGTIEFYGTKTAVHSASFLLDATSPSTSLDDLPFLMCESCTLRGNATDIGSGIASVEFSMRFSHDNATWSDWSLVSSSTGSPYEFVFSAHTGFYQLRVVAVDYLGHQEQHDGDADALVRIFSPDCNGDGTINVVDFVNISLHWQEREGEDAYNYDADLNADGVINILDLSLVAWYWPR